MNLRQPSQILPSHLKAVAKIMGVEGRYNQSSVLECMQDDGLQEIIRTLADWQNSKGHFIAVLRVPPSTHWNTSALAVMAVLLFGWSLQGSLTT
jgi:hypothetical protein